jgi:hypothetical protein
MCVKMRFPTRQVCRKEWGSKFVCLGMMMDWNLVMEFGTIFCLEWPKQRHNSIDDHLLAGESTHGTTEFYQHRATITKRLVEEQDFNLILIEVPPTSAVAPQNCRCASRRRHPVAR